MSHTPLMKQGKKGCHRQILKITLAETIYEMWRNINEIIFSQKNLDPSLKDVIIHNVIARRRLHRKFSFHVITYSSHNEIDL